MGQMVVIDDSTNYVEHPVDGEMKSRGLIPRDYSTHPEGCFAMFAEPFPDSLLIPPSDQQAWLTEQQAKKRTLSDLRQRSGGALDSLDQDGYGYCWAFSTTKAVMYCRAIANEAPLRLSAWAVAAIIKNYRDQGGWGGESLEFIVNTGVPTLDVWPQKQVKRELDNPTMRENAKLHRITEWWEGSSNKDKATEQMKSALLRGYPCVTDFNHWGHSILTIGLKTLNEIYVDNSWGSGWSENGVGVLAGSKIRPDGLWIPRVVTSSEK